jgi:hypothetical protein
MLSVCFHSDLNLMLVELIHQACILSDGVNLGSAKIGLISILLAKAGAI